MPEMSYPGRDALRIMAAQVDAEPERSGRAYIARSLLAALDAHGHDLEALARRLDALEAQADTGAPCADCGERPGEHGATPLLDIAPHAYRAPEAPTAYPEPTPAQVETGRDLAGMAEADGAVSDGADVPWMIARELADAYWKGHAAGRNYGGPTPQAAPALPDWVTETTPCAACPEDIKHEHDDNGWTDDDGDHRGHAFEAEPVHAIAVTFYVAAPQDLDADTIRAMFGSVLDHSTAREALAAGLDGADPRVTLLGVTDPTAPAR